jgi:hypothetical protein
MTREELIEDGRNIAENIRQFLEQNNGQKEETISDLIKRWIGNVRTYDEENQDKLFFRNKPRGYGQPDGSTDGRLRRKLMREVASQYAKTSNDTNIINYRNAVINAQQQSEKSIANSKLNEVVSEYLKKRLKFISSPQLKKALFLTKEKLRNPLEYKQQYGRIAPFGEDEQGNPKWVKASRRFHTMYNGLTNLHLSNDKKTRMPPVQEPPTNFPKFGKKELMDDVGQGDIAECGLQAGAASLPRSALGNMFSWKPSYKRDGVTVRLHGKKNGSGNGTTPMYIRLQNDQLYHDNSKHKAVWPFALSAAVAKAGIEKIRKIRKDKDEVYNKETGLPMYTLQDVDGVPMDDISMFLTGKPIAQKNEINLADTPGQKGKRNALKALSANHPNRYGVVTVKEMDSGYPHALLYKGIDNKTGEPILINTWDKDFIEERNKNNPFNILAQREVDASTLPWIFQRMSRAYVLPQGADPANDIYLNRKDPPRWHQRNLGLLVQIFGKENKREEVGNLDL